MNEATIEKAAALLVSMRPGDRWHPNHFQRLEAYKAEIRSHLQVQAALQLAGRNPQEDHNE